MVKYFLLFAGVLVSIVLLLSLPVRYQITLYNSQYYGLCSSSPADNAYPPCQVYDPPQVIEKQKPLFLAWADKVAIERRITTKEATTSWVSSSNISRNAAISLIPFAIASGLFIYGFRRHHSKED